LCNIDLGFDVFKNEKVFDSYNCNIIMY